jgi:hypothetical protein
VDFETVSELFQKGQTGTVFTFDKERKNIKVWDFSPNLREQIGYDCIEHPITDDIRT